MELQRRWRKGSGKKGERRKRKIKHGMPLRVYSRFDKVSADMEDNRASQLYCIGSSEATEKKGKQKGLLRELNPGPLAPGARIIPLDQAADSMLA